MANTKLLTASIFSCLLAGGASATPFTEKSNTTSPGFDVTTQEVGATSVGGIVVDLLGSNGAHIVGQAKDNLFSGFMTSGTVEIGRINNFSGLLAGLGGGLKAAGFRFTLFDGDTASGEGDDGDLRLLVNGKDFAGWSGVQVDETNSTGIFTSTNSSGFRNEKMDTGWFYSTNETDLAALFVSLKTDPLIFSVKDIDTFSDTSLDFSLAVPTNSSTFIKLILPPGGGNAVPEPATGMLIGLGLLGLFSLRRGT